jgi:hypothetical protein
LKLALAALATLCALVPAAAGAAATPDPETLKSVLADPPSSDYVEADTTVKGEGPLDAQTYASILATDSTKQQRVVNGLSSDGFVAGYGRVWAKRAAGVALVEQVLAFGDNSGAKSYEGASKLADMTAVGYTGTIDTSTVPDSYGVEDLSGGFHSTAIVFVKGNDLIVTAFVSGADYLVSDTVTQAQAVYSHAPDYTIQPAASSTADTNSVAYQAGRLAGGVLVGVLVLGVIGLVVGLVLRQNRRRPALAAPLPFTLSSDGSFWWDGTVWQDSMSSAPPSAQRSPDGAFWWDGRSWRPVPQPAGAAS